jgi:hypothetical protein
MKILVGSDNPVKRFFTRGVMDRKQLYVQRLYFRE